MTALLLARVGQTEMRLTGAVIKAADYASLVTLAQAAVQARALFDEQVALAQSEREAAREAGFAEGLRQAQQQQARLLTEAAQRAAAYIDNLDRDVVTLVLQVVRRLGLELGAAAVVADLAAHALRQMRGQQRLTVRVHPEAQRAVSDRLNAVAAELEIDGFIDVLADPDLDRFDCTLRSEVGVVRADLSLQLAAVEEVLRQAVGRGNGA